MSHLAIISGFNLDTCGIHVFKGHTSSTCRIEHCSSILTVDITIVNAFGLPFCRPKAALLFLFFGDFRCDVSLLIVIRVIYKYRNR